jgi:hypothetical protein
MAKYFTVAEANQVVGIIRPLMQQLMELRQSIQARQPEAWLALEKAGGNGGNKASSKIALEFEKMESLVQAIQGTGAVVKDLNGGLVDFLTIREGREVYLCWQYGEDEIQFWHDIDTGFSSRQPL